MRMTLKTALLLAILVLLAAGCTDSCCTKQKCIDKYDLGDPDDCYQWSLDHGCVEYPSPGTPIKIRKPGGAGSQITYEKGAVSLQGVDYTSGTQRDDFIGFKIHEFKCIAGGNSYDAQHIEIAGSGPTLGIERTSLGTVLWSLSQGGNKAILAPTPPESPGPPPPASATVPNHVLVGFTGQIQDIVASRTCDEVHLSVYETFP